MLDQMIMMAYESECGDGAVHKTLSEMISKIGRGDTEG